MWQCCAVVGEVGGGGDGDKQCGGGEGVRKVVVWQRGKEGGGGVGGGCWFTFARYWPGVAGPASSMRGLIAS